MGIPDNREEFKQVMLDEHFKYFLLTENMTEENTQIFNNYFELALKVYYSVRREGLVDCFRNVLKYGLDKSNLENPGPFHKSLDEYVYYYPQSSMDRKCIYENKIINDGLDFQGVQSKSKRKM